MSDKELEEYINKIEPNFDSHLEKGTIEMSNEYYNLLEEKMVRLINKNQELKKQLEENKDKINWYENFEINKTIDKLRIKHNNQQKEFIKFLEYNYKETQDIWYIKILQKYKEIIGGIK